MSITTEKTIRILDCPVQALSMGQTINLIDHNLQAGRFIQHVVVNVAKLIHMKTDQNLKQSVVGCDLINIDGMGVVWGARFLGYEIPERVAGIDLFLELISLSAKRNYPIFLLGAKQEVVDEVSQRFALQYPSLKIAGVHHGYFWDNEELVVEKIQKSGAKLLFVAISSPQKQVFINKWKKELGVNFVMGVGGSFDIIAGKTKRAPLWMQNSGLEWFYRLVQEPSRMWKRYLITNTLFAIALVKEKIKQA